MPATEIYLCKIGQPVKEGQLVHGDIADKDEAKSDAEERFHGHPGLAKIVYYHVKEDGDFRMLHTATNPNAKVLNTGGAAKPSGPSPRGKAKPKPKPKGLWGKFNHWLNT